MDIYLGKTAGLEVRAARSAILSWFALWIGAGFVAVLWAGVDWAAGLATGLGVTVLHMFCTFIHQLGHASAARRTGHPMSGVRFWFLLSISRYPRSEGPLPPVAHIRRAAGGPVASLGLALLAAIVTWLLRPGGGVPFWLAAFTAFDSLVIFTLGSLLPLGFTDGSTLLRWWRSGR